MARIHSGAAEIFSRAADVARRLKRLSGPRFLAPAAGAVAAAAVAAPILYFGAAGEDAPVAAARTLRTPEKIAELIVAGEPAAAEAPAKAAAPRVSRIEPGTTLTPGPRSTVLADDDPRWARSDDEGVSDMPEPVRTAELREKITRLKDLPAETETPPLGLAVQTAPPPTDATFTGTIRQDDTAEEAEPASVVDSSSASAAFAGEPAASAEPEPQIEDTAAAEPALPVEEIAPSEATGRTARVTTHVNMRSGPENEAAVVTVLPTGADVKVIGGCEHWCEVDFDGTRGYVYKSFISGT